MKTKYCLLFVVYCLLFNANLFALSDKILQVEKQLEEINARGEAVNNYEFTKALSYLHVAKQEETRNGKNSVIKESLLRAKEQVSLLTTTGDKSLEGVFSSTNPIGNVKEKTRPDLWKRIDELKKHQGLRCATHKIAEAEVLIVWGAYHGERLGRTYEQTIYKMAEDKLLQGERLARFCHLSICPWSTEKFAIADNCFMAGGCAVNSDKDTGFSMLSIEADALFAFDKYEFKDIKAQGVEKLNKFSDFVKNSPKKNYKIYVVGHTDILGTSSYNDLLSTRRALTVKKYLGSRGLDMKMMEESGMGKNKQIHFCEDKNLKGKALYECLQPNRRVEVYLKFLE